MRICTFRMYFSLTAFNTASAALPWVSRKASVSKLILKKKKSMKKCIFFVFIFLKKHLLVEKNSILKKYYILCNFSLPTWLAMKLSLMEDGACDQLYLQMEIHTMKGKKWGSCFSVKSFQSFKSFIGCNLEQIWCIFMVMWSHSTSQSCFKQI